MYDVANQKNIYLNLKGFGPVFLHEDDSEEPPFATSEMLQILGVLGYMHGAS